MVKKLLKRLLLGRVYLQPFFERLYTISLSGMNYGAGAYLQKSGESIVIDYLARNIANDTIPVVFDVGANVGEYSLMLLSALGEQVSLHSFEPSKKAFRALSQNLGKYRNARLFNIGFSNEENATGVLYSDSEGSVLASLFPRKVNHHGMTLACKEDVTLTTLDKFAAERGINKIHLLKLDAEGSEFNILRGASNLINSGAIELIQFEFGPCNIDSRTFFQDFFYLLNPRYRIHRLLRDGLAPIDNYSELLEVFRVTVYLAVSRN